VAASGLSRESVLARPFTQPTRSPSSPSSRNLVLPCPDVLGNTRPHLSLGDLTATAGPEISAEREQDQGPWPTDGCPVTKRNTASSSMSHQTGPKRGNRESSGTYTPTGRSCLYQPLSPGTITEGEALGGYMSRNSRPAADQPLPVTWVTDLVHQRVRPVITGAGRRLDPRRARPRPPSGGTGPGVPGRATARGVGGLPARW
jgi:hypothetical protein